MMIGSTAVLLPILLSVAIAAITRQQEEQQLVNSLEINLNQSKQALKDAQQNLSNSVTFSNHRPIYVAPVNISQYRYANNATLVRSQKLTMETPQIYQVEAPRLNQFVVPYENHLRAPEPHMVKSLQIKQQQPRTLEQQVHQSIMVAPDFQNNNGSAEQRLFGHFIKHSPNCPNHPPLFPPPIGPPCGGVFAGSTVLRHPGFPGPYPASIRCTYTILPQNRAPTRRACFRVSFVNVALRWSHNCQQDWIQIDQGARLCGGLSGDKYYQTSGNLILEFHSGNLPGPERSGFHILVSTIPCHLIAPPQHSPPHICPPKPRPPFERPPSPGHYPPGNDHPGHPPPGYLPPGRYPPGQNHPGHNPPGHLPPGRYPLGNNHPGHDSPRPYPPNYRSPGNHPPIVRPPPIQENHTPFWWRWYRVLKCEWKGIKNLPPGLCPPPHHSETPNYHPPHSQPPPYQPPHLQPYTPPPPLPYNPPNTTPFPPRPPTHRPPPPPVSEMCSRFIASPQFVVTSDEWLSQGIPHTQNRGWSCHLSIIKAGPTACEVFLQLENLNLQCGVEFVEVGGQRICGNQPFRQLSVDFRSYEITIEYHNIAGETTPGNFAIRGHQNFDCDPLILDVSPAKKLSPLVATTPRVFPPESQKVS